MLFRPTLLNNLPVTDMKQNNEDGPALICIPDITGFTRFMAETDLEFSRKIIPPLLRCLVASNTLAMNVGEVEGDAILFYRFGALPTLHELTEQCKKFYNDFNEQLELLKKQFPDNFAKYISSNKLSLKIIVHAAEMTSTHIEGMIKLIGEDVVVVHKLLKNSVEEAEYILFTEKLLSHFEEDEVNELLNWDILKDGKDEYEYIGEIKYKYIPLRIAPEAAKGLNKNGKVTVIPKITPLRSQTPSVQQSREPK
jgi:hypothetical protein